VQVVKKPQPDLPAQYDSIKGGDPFMERVVRQYGEKLDTKPGRFFINYKNLRTLAEETMIKNKKMLPYWASVHIDQQFDKAWHHFDNLSQGVIDVDQVHNLLRMVSRDSTI